MHNGLKLTFESPPTSKSEFVNACLLVLTIVLKLRYLEVYFGTNLKG